MDTLAWIIVGIFSGIILLILTLTIVIFVRLRKRTTIKATIFLKTGGQVNRNIKRTESNFTVNKKSYTFDEQAVIKTSFRDYIYYMENNPIPIIYDFKNSKPLMYGDDLTLVLENDLATKLFSSKLLDNLLLLTMIILGGVLICIVLLVYIMMSDVTLANNPQNIEILTNVTRNVMSGGLI